MSVNNWYIKIGKTKSCGCLRKKNFENTKKANGENHGNWKGGISGERDRDMSTKKYKEWRKNVFERDKYTCKKCGQMGYEIHAHHIAPYSENKKLRYEIDNGITLCKKCHIEFHRKFGIKNIGEYEIYKYLEKYIKEANNESTIYSTTERS